MGYYGGDVWRYPAAGNGSYYFMLTQRLWHWEGAPQGWDEPGISGPAKIDIGLAFSTDMVRFTHLGGREPFIGVGRDGSWESRFVWAAPQPVIMEELGEIWIYYSGINSHGRVCHLDVQIIFHLVFFAQNLCSTRFCKEHKMKTKNKVAQN